MIRRVIKIGIINCIILLLLAGCGKQEDKQHTVMEIGQESERTETQTEDAVLWNRIGLLNPMELITYEDAASENLADKLQNNGKNIMVQVRYGNVYGSGVIFDVNETQVRILTAAHIFNEEMYGEYQTDGLEANERPVFVLFSDDFTVQASACICDSKLDAAVIIVDRSDIPADNLKNYAIAACSKEVSDGLQNGDGCIAMGCRTGVAAECYEGVILDSCIYMEDYGSFMIWAQTYSKAGMSGGGLFTREGYLIGILSGINEDQLAVVPLGEALKVLLYLE